MSVSYPNTDEFHVFQYPQERGYLSNISFEGELVRVDIFPHSIMHNGEIFTHPHGLIKDDDGIFSYASSYSSTSGSPGARRDAVVNDIVRGVIDETSDPTLRDELFEMLQKNTGGAVLVYTYEVNGESQRDVFVIRDKKELDFLRRTNNDVARFFVRRPCFIEPAIISQDIRALLGIERANVELTHWELESPREEGGLRKDIDLARQACSLLPDKNTGIHTIAVGTLPDFLPHIQEELFHSDSAPMSSRELKSIVEIVASLSQEKLRALWDAKGVIEYAAIKFIGFEQKVDIRNSFVWSNGNRYVYPEKVGTKTDFDFAPDYAGDPQALNRAIYSVEGEVHGQASRSKNVSVHSHITSMIQGTMMKVGMLGEVSDDEFVEIVKENTAKAISSMMQRAGFTFDEERGENGEWVAPEDTTDKTPRAAERLITDAIRASQESSLRESNGPGELSTPPQPAFFEGRR